MSRIVTGLFGGKSKSEKVLERFTPAGFSSAGATGRYDKATSTFTLGRTPARDAAVAGVVSGYNAQANAFAGLRGSVAPGAGRLSESLRASTQSRIDALRGDRRRTVGNIRENLARRRLAGSSFQASEAAAAEAEFSREEDRVRAEGAVAEAEAFLQEISLSGELIQKEFQSSIAGAQAVLTDLNFDTSVAAELSGLSSQLMNANLTAQAEARAAAEAAGEDFLGTILGIFGGKLGGNSGVP